MSKATTPNAEKGVPHDFVYGGRRLLVGDKVGAAIFVVGELGALGEALLFDAKSFKHHAIGGVYRGATFSEKSIHGIGNAKYVEMWQGQAQRIDWRSRDEAVESELRLLKMVKDTKKVHEIEAILLPLRKMYAGYASRRDSAGQEALEEAMIRALRTAPRSGE